MELLYFSSKKIIGISCLIATLMTVFLMTRIYNKTDQPLNPSSYYVDFDQSMKVDLYPDIKNSAQGSQLLTLFKQVYDAHNLKLVSDKNIVIIPKIIHIMWLGGKLPQEYEAFVKSWRDLHPQWTIIFWTDSHLNYDRGSHIIRSFDDLSVHLQNSTKSASTIVVDVTFLSFDNKDMYDDAINYGEKSDILNWEIV
jgi:mannosyltransferase OCH1-like enzyme